MRFLLTAVVVMAAASTAVAHGGAYRGAPKPTSAGAVPPGTADRGGALSTWETWWSANKEFHLRLHERMRDDGAAITPRAGDGPENAAELRRNQDTLTREEMILVFLEAMKDDSFEVRTAAAIALGKMGDTGASTVLRAAAEKDTHKDVRDSAVLALGMLGLEENVPYLLSILSDRTENTRFRSFAAFGLGMTGGEDTAALLLRVANGRKKLQGPLAASIYVALGLTGSESVLPTLRDAAADHADDNVRAFAVLSLGRMRDVGSLDAVTRFLGREKKENMRRSAAITLGKIATSDDAEVVQKLERALEDSDPMVRHFSAVALGEISDAAIRERLRKRLPKAMKEDRPFYALALALAGSTDSAPLVRAAMRAETNENLKSGYCIALGIMGDAEAIPQLTKLAQERGDIWLPGYAALALGMIGSRESAEMLRGRLKTENDPRLRMNLAVALGLLHDPAARDHLIETVRGTKGTIYERASAAMALGVLRINSAAPDLLAVYRNKKEQDLVRAMTIVALGVLADPSEIPKLARFSIDNNYGVRVDPLNEVLSIL
jgi:HEAT repeat protein